MLMVYILFVLGFVILIAGAGILVDGAPLETEHFRVVVYEYSLEN